MKLLDTTLRYYLFLTTLLFAVGGLGLYCGINWALRTETDRLLLLRQQELLEKAHANQLPNVQMLETLLVVSRQPRLLGFSDTVVLDKQQHELVPHRQLTFPLTMRGEAPVWVTLRKSLIEAKDLLEVILAVLLGMLLLLLGGAVLLNRRLTQRIWGPFQHTLATLQNYDLQQQPLTLPTPAVAELAELTQTLNTLSQRLVTEHERLREFTAHAAHETQVPLATMQEQLEQLLLSPALAADPTAAARVASLYGATLRLSRLHQALGLLSKIENRQFPLAVPLSLDRALEEKVAELEPLFDARELRYGLDIATEPIILNISPVLADSLLQNLLQNAVKHNVRGGELAITLTPQYLKVSNTGPAIVGDPTRFFERFQKHNAASDSPGLGLSIVQRICDYYGFGLEYSVAEEGTRHTLSVALNGAVIVPVRKPSTSLVAT